jgi:hypothetical protein
LRAASTTVPKPPSSPAEPSRAVASREPSPAAPSSRRDRSVVAPLGQRRHRVELTASDALVDKLDRARALLSHSQPGCDIADVIDQAVTLLVERLETKRFGARRAKKGTKQAATTHPRTEDPVDASAQAPAHRCADDRPGAPWWWPGSSGTGAVVGVSSRGSGGTGSVPLDLARTTGGAGSVPLDFACATGGALSVPPVFRRKTGGTDTVVAVSRCETPGTVRFLLGGRGSGGVPPELGRWGVRPSARRVVRGAPSRSRRR